MDESRNTVDAQSLNDPVVAEEDPAARPCSQSPDQDAGQDQSINRRLERNPESKEARLDTALDESMDASDPPSSTQPVHNQYEAAPSSGYDADAEKRLRRERDQE